MKRVTTISAALLEAKQVEESIGQALSDFTIGKSIKDKISAGYLSIAIQHHSSIINLVEKELPSSAAALLRPLLEACYRGIWFSWIANDNQANAFNKNDGSFELKQTYKLAKDIDRKIQSDTFHKIYEKNSTTLHGFTHGGIEQVTRQFSQDHMLVTPSFKEGELIEILVSSNANLAMALLAFAKNMDNQELEEIATKILLE